MRNLRLSLAVFLLALLATPAVRAGTITGGHIVALPSGQVGSGNGTLDLRLFTFSGSEIENSTFDNGNNTLPQGGGADTSAFAESYVTTAGDLQSFYSLNVPGLMNIQLVLFLDLNETGGGAGINQLALLDIILNPATVQGNPDPSGDVTSDEQAAINQIFTGGSTLAFLDPEPAATLPVVAMGAGFADYAIATGINPFNLDPSDVLLFNISMNTLSSGAEEIFLSGEVRDVDIGGFPPIPEPSTLLLLGAGLAGLTLVRRRWEI